jgi:signal transduction histidine kinase
VSDEPARPLDGPALERLRHDVRTPLTIVSGFAEVLAAERAIPDAQRREFAQRIAAAAEELRRILDERLA